MTYDCQVGKMSVSKREKELKFVEETRVLDKCKSSDIQHGKYISILFYVLVVSPSTYLYIYIHKEKKVVRNDKGG